MSSYGSESMGEVSKGTASTTFTGHRSQPGDAARQPLTVNDSTPSGVSALPGLSALSGVSALPGLSALPGQSFHSAAIHGDTPMDVEMGPALAGLLGSPALPDSRSISIPGIPTLPGAQPSLSGVRPPPGFTGTPRGPGNVHGRGNCQPSGRHHPSTVNDVALSGHSALPGLSALPGQSSHSAIHGDTPLEVERAGISLPCYLSPALGPSPPSRELGHPRDSSNLYGVRGIFRAGANASHQAGTAPPLWWN